MSRIAAPPGHPSRSPESIAAARKKIEEGIAEHYRTATRMKIELNTLISIACLPSEILSEIFLRYVHAMVPDNLSFESTFNLRPTFRYIKITHICHHWREVALNSPRLWSYINVGSPKVTGELLARSKAVSLTVKAHHSYTSFDSLAQIFGAFSRIQKIDLGLLPENYAKLTSYFPRNAARLRKLALFNTTGTLKFPTVFEECALPSLGDLRIEGYSLPWPNPIFVPSLTRLVVHAPRRKDVTPDHVFDILQNLQNLRHLELSQLGWLMVEPNDELPPAGRQVTLPKLASLRLTHEISVCAYTLRQLVFPSNATVELYLNYAPEGADITQLAPVVFDKLSGDGVLGPRLPILSVGLFKGKGIVNKITRLCCWRGDELPSSPDKADFLVSFSPDNAAIKSVLKHFGSMIPCEEVVAFCMQGDTPIYTGGIKWSDALEAMPNLEVLHVVGLESLHLLEILLPVDTVNAKSSGNYDPDFLMQDLTSLTISEMKFPYNDNGRYLNKLIKIFLSRQEACSGLSDLELRKCANFFRSDFEELADVIENVEWDGMVEAKKNVTWGDSEDSEEDSEEDSSDYDDEEDYELGSFEEDDCGPPDSHDVFGW